MSDLLIQDLDPELARQLEESACKHGRGLSDEAKWLLQKSPLREALTAGAGGRKLGTLMRQLLPPEYRSDDYVFEIRGEASKPPEFD
jgi:plasmid stability protein